MKNTAPSKQNSSRIPALLCVAGLAACLLLMHPVAEMGFIDDWSYIYSARVLADTGHLQYNGWATAMLGWQLYLGALFIKLFGFSFTVTRASTLLVTLPGTYLLHRVMVRFGLTAWNAAFGTLVVVLSPVFLPVVFSFMSDACGFFVLILCFYLCQRAIQARSDRAALAWLCFAAITNMVGGTVRQTSWLGVLVIVPSAAWLMRKRRGALPVGAVLWITGLLAVRAGNQWFHHQLYSVPEESVFRAIDWHVVSRFLRSMGDTLFSLPLFVAPVLGSFPARLAELPARKRRQAWLWVGGFTAVLCGVTLVAVKRGQELGMLVLPWLSTLVTADGIVRFGNIAGAEPQVLPIGLRSALTLALAIITVCCLIWLWLAPRVPAPDAEPESRESLTWPQTAGLLLPFFFSYFALLLPRATFRLLFDRYLPPLELVLVILILRYAQQRPLVQNRTRRVSAALSLCAFLLLLVYGVAGTHDFFAMARARVTAAGELLRAGVPRTAIGGGMEYDGWTQIEAGGYIDYPDIVKPPGAQHPRRISGDPCEDGLIYSAPAIHPRYAIAYEPVTCYTPSGYPPVPYTTWLPPYGQKVYVQKVPDTAQSMTPGSQQARKP